MSQGVQILILILVVVVAGIAAILLLWQPAPKAPPKAVTPPTKAKQQSFDPDSPFGPSTTQTRQRALVPSQVRIKQEPPVTVPAPPNPEPKPNPTAARSKQDLLATVPAPPNPDLEPAPAIRVKQELVATMPAPALEPAALPNLGGSPDIEITMMGALPKEFLDIIKGKITGDLPQAKKADPEDSVEIDTQFCDESLAEEPTGVHPMILATGVARSDRGLRRKCNEDAFLDMPDEPLFVVADGMGGHNAGDVASRLAVDIIEKAFRTQSFDGETHPEWPRRGDELVRSIHMANAAVFEASSTAESLIGMGTTIVAIRFSLNKQRAYIAHVGDSRCYRVRDRQLYQLTEDHTLGNLIGMKGKNAKHLARAVGIGATVAVDLTVDEPKPKDIYIVASDGLTKMMSDEAILRMALEISDVDALSKELIDEANRLGGRDNTTVIAIRIESVIKAPDSMKVIAG